MNALRFKSLECSSHLKQDHFMTVTKEVFKIEDVEVFDVLNSAFRQQIMRRLQEPKSVKQVADEMEVPVTRLYYHVNRLAEYGVIEVVEERKTGAMIEKIYQTAARTFAPGPGLLTSDNDPAELARIAAGVVLDQARADAETALAAHFASGGATDDIPGAIGRGAAFMTRTRAREFADRVNDLLGEMKQDEDAEGAEEFSLSVVFFPTGIDS